MYASEISLSVVAWYVTLRVVDFRICSDVMVTLFFFLRKE